jgi:uncharacterized protein YndB with AHSA1/START domain
LPHDRAFFPVDLNARKGQTLRRLGHGQAVGQQAPDRAGVGISQGWPLLLAGLKSLLETGDVLTAG